MQTRSILIALLLVGTMAVAAPANAADNSDASNGSTATPPSQHSIPERDRHGGGMQGGMGGMQGGMGGMQGGMGGMQGGMGGMQGGGMTGGRMMGGGMMGMMNGCSRMTGNTAMPHLPPGNEKLQLKMQAEIMQKSGEILMKYADQLHEPKR